MKRYVNASSEWSADWSARLDKDKGLHYYVLSFPTGTAYVLPNDKTGSIYHAEIKFTDGNNRHSVGFEDMYKCMDWAENILSNYKKVTSSVNVKGLDGFVSWNGYNYGRLRGKGSKPDRYFKSRTVRFDDSMGGTEEVSMDEYVEVAKKYRDVMQEDINSSSQDFKVLTPEDVEKLKKAIKERRFYSCWTRLGKKYIKDKDMYQYFESQLEGQTPGTLTIKRFDDLIADELENEYVYESTEDDDYLDQPLPAEIQAEIDRVQSTYPQLEVTIVVDDWYGDSVSVYNNDNKATVNEDLEESVDDVSAKKFKSVLNTCVKGALSWSHNKED